jgi:TAG lipase / steryl ester hydrolase / phospholipase A2 / LPA acyltransferase
MGALFSKNAESNALVLSPQQRRDLVVFVRRTLGSSFHYFVRFWIYVTGLEGHEVLLRKLFLQFKYRANADPRNASAYHCMAMTVVDIWLRTLRVVLVPDVFMRFLCATFILHIFYEMKSRVRKLLVVSFQQLTARGRRQLRLSRMLKQAKTFQERQAIAGELDKIEGKDRWRENPESGLYLYERVINKTQMYKVRPRGATRESEDRRWTNVEFALRFLQRLQLNSDVMGLMFSLRAGLLRKHWGLGNPRLYSVSHGPSNYFFFANGYPIMFYTEN